MSVTRRTLLTASAAGTLLAALWFVPSANATVETAPNAARQAAVATAQDDTSGPQLAETGPGVDT
ncbi:hypothetical protein RM844_32020, partial [Streptomyces sp. DSM 44915]|nr:hypothetical protein [Streptomyces sp. DSM 44915]